MRKMYSLREINHIATILERPRRVETIQAFKSAINDHFNSDCNLNSIDLTQCSNGAVQYVGVTIDNVPHSIEVSETNLY